MIGSIIIYIYVCVYIYIYTYIYKLQKAISQSFPRNALHYMPLPIGTRDICFRPPVHPKGFLGISLTSLVRNGLTFDMLMYDGKLQNWLDFGFGMLIFFILVPLRFVETAQVFGHFLKNAWEEWPESLHAYVSWPPTDLIRFWLRGVGSIQFTTN